MYFCWLTVKGNGGLKSPLSQPLYAHKNQHTSTLNFVILISEKMCNIFCIRLDRVFFSYTRPRVTFVTYCTVFAKLAKFTAHGI